MATLRAPETVVLELSPSEAKVLARLLALVSGCGPVRKEADAIYEALERFDDNAVLFTGNIFAIE